MDFHSNIMLDDFSSMLGNNFSLRNKRSTIQPKELSKETKNDVQNKSLREDEVSDGPLVPRTYVVNVEPEKDKASHVPPAPYPYRLTVPKKTNNHSEIYEWFKQVKVNFPLLDMLS